jgi:SMC interacting uncharacterized protein involved in chromosome segregation
MDLDQFVSMVITWDPGSALQEVLAGPIQSFTQSMELVANEIEQKNEEIEELQERIEELEDQLDEDREER